MQGHILSKAGDALRAIQKKITYKLLYVIRKAVIIIQQWKQTRGARHTQSAQNDVSIMVS